MTPIDYENLFIYMSLIFAICIFITLLYACVFTGSPKIEKFRGDEDNMKDQILHLLNDLKSKDTTTEDDKANLDVIIQTFSSSNVNVNDLVSIIKQLKRFAPASPASPASPKTVLRDAPSVATPAVSTALATPAEPSRSNEPNTAQQDKEIPLPTPAPKRIPIDPATLPSPTPQTDIPTPPAAPMQLAKINRIS